LPASVAERHPRQFGAKLFDFDRIGGSLKSISKLHEGRPSVFVRANGVAQEIGKRTVTADSTRDGNGINFDAMSIGTATSTVWTSERTAGIRPKNTPNTIVPVRLERQYAAGTVQPWN
jgi:hypothetical protein